MHNNMLSDDCYFSYADGDKIGIFDIIIYTHRHSLHSPIPKLLGSYYISLFFIFVSLGDVIIDFILDFDE
jgi:hypothetical protein